jgi:signal transduction histidine kinase
VPLLLRLFLLVAVALLPAIAIQTYNEIELRRARQAEVQDQALGLARLAAANQQQIVQGIRQILIALSEVPAIKAKDNQACKAYLSAVKQRYPAFLTFSVTDMTGRSYCDTINDHEPVTAAGRPYFSNAVKTGAFTVGKFSVGRLSGRNAIHFALPYYGDDGRMAGVIIAALSLDWLADYIARKGVPPGASLAITDRDGTYLARYPDNDRFVGRKIPNDEYWGVDHPGTADAIDVDGVERIVGYSTLEGDSGALLASVGLDKTRAFTEIQRGTQRGIFLIVLGTSLALILTWLGARRFIHRPLGQLVEAANQWRLGAYARRVSIHKKHSEIARVGDALNTMAGALEDRERELRVAKEKAEEAAARITTVFENTTDSVFIVDRDWRVSYLNERAKLRVAGGRDLIGMDLWAVFPEAVESEVYRRYRAASDQRPGSFEMFCPPHNAWYEVNVFPSGQGIAVYLRDITEHKRALDARRLIEEQLHQSQKMEAVGQLTGGLAHDFNNLLMVVLGNLALIEDGAENSDRVRQLAAAARRAADRGAKLTAQLLAFSRRQTLKPRVVYADHLIREFQGLIQRTVGGGCEIKLITDCQLWPCQVDPAQLETALLNLTLNGRDAMPGGGIVEIEARNVILDEGAVDGLAHGPYVSLSVTDNGCGVPPENLERVFEPFFTTKEVGKGTGLGLSMVYGFVKQSGGDVTIESAVGVGAKVTLYLPTVVPNAEIEAEDVEAQAPLASPARILVVEDDEQVQEVTAAMLMGLGYQVLRAGNGADAIQILKSDRGLDLLFSDIAMHQGMNGVELARAAKRMRNGIKVLLTSGYPGDVLARYRALDEFPIINKPFSQAELARCLRSALYDA